MAYFSNLFTSYCFFFLVFRLKVEQSVEAPRELAINAVPYTLIGKILHHGKSINSGHYTAFVRHNKDWILANDSTVTWTEKEEKQDKDTFIIIYEKV